MSCSHVGQGSRAGFPQNTVEARPTNRDTQSGDTSQKTFHPVSVAISEAELEGGFKHWVVFVGNSEDSSQVFLCNPQGSSGRYRYEHKIKDVHRPGDLTEIVKVGEVLHSDLKKLRAVARQLPIRNDIPAWNCQDYAWALMEELAARGVTDRDDKIYTLGREIVWSKMEGRMDG